MRPIVLTRMTAALLTGALCLTAQAAPRTFVASFGGDANPCSVASPCRTFSQALTQTDAGGEIIALDSAGYGTVVIGKSVSIIAPPGVYAGVGVSIGNGILVNGTGIRVTLRGLSVIGQGGLTGIVFANGAELDIEDCSVNGMADGGGIQLLAAAGRTTITNSSSTRNTGSGILIMGTDAQVVLRGVRVEDNSEHGVLVRGGNARVTAVGLSIARTANHGFLILPVTSGGSVRAVIEDSEFVDNGADGAVVMVNLGDTATMSATRSLFANNGAGGFGGLGAGNAILAITDSLVQGNGAYGVGVTSLAPGTMQVVASRNTVTKNGTGMLNSGAAFLSRGDNTVTGNTTEASGAITPLAGQ